MQLNVFADPLQGAVFLICILTTPVCSLATLLRFVNTKRSGRSINLEDWFALVALVSFWMHAAMAIWTVVILNGKDRFKPGILSLEEIILEIKVGYAMQLNFPFNPTFAKLSLLALYHRIFRVDRTYVRWIWAFAILQILWFWGIFLTRAMFCVPFSKFFSPNFPEGCINASLLLAVGEAINAAIAFGMIILAMFMVRTLSMSNGTKWKLRLLFVLGGFTGVIDIISIVEAYGQITSNLIYLCFVTIQMMVNSICCCAPVYRTIFPEIPLLNKLTSKLSGFYGSGSRSEKTSRSKNTPDHTLVTIGGTARKRGAGDPEWIELNGERAATPDLCWTDAEHRADIETGNPPVTQTPPPAQRPNRGSHGVHVHRTFEVV